MRLRIEIVIYFPFYSSLPLLERSLSEKSSLARAPIWHVPFAETVSKTVCPFMDLFGGLVFNRSFAISFNKAPSLVQSFAYAHLSSPSLSQPAPTAGLFDPYAGSLVSPRVLFIFAWTSSIMISSCQTSGRVLRSYLRTGYFLDSRTYTLHFE